PASVTRPQPDSRYLQAVGRRGRGRLRRADPSRADVPGLRRLHQPRKGKDHQVRLTRWTLGIVGDLLVTAGLVLLLFVGWQLWFTDVTANRTQDATVSRLTRDFAAPPATPGTETPKAVPFGPAF